MITVKPQGIRLRPFSKEQTTDIEKGEFFHSVRIKSGLCIKKHLMHPFHPSILSMNCSSQMH